MGPTPTSSDRLDSWKAIADYLGCTEATAQGWERTALLPVRRPVPGAPGSVYAFVRELDEWRATRGRTLPRATAAAGGAPSQRVSWLGSAAGLLVIGVATAYLWSSTAERVNVPPTLAIVPFEVESSAGADTQALGFSVAEAIAGHLEGATDLDLRPFAAAPLPTPTPVDVAAAGLELDASAIVTGRLRPAAAGLTISVTLVDVDTRTEIWGQLFEASDAVLARTQERIALEIRARLLRHTRGDSYRLAVYAPSNVLSEHPAALRLYLRARSGGRGSGRVQTTASLTALETAVALDPRFAAAYGLLAAGYVALPYVVDLPAATAHERSAAYTRQALALDPLQRDALKAAAGAAHWTAFDHGAAEQQFRAALAAHPNDAGIHAWYAEFLLSMGRFEEALDATAAAERAAPDWLEVDVIRGNVFLYSERPMAAIGMYERALAIDPNHGMSRLFLGHAYLALGEWQAALTELRRADQALGGVPLSRASLAYALGRSGDRRAGEAMLAAMMASRAAGQYPAFAIAEAHLGLGHAEAVEWLERAAGERLVGYYMPNVDVRWRPLHSNERMRALLRQLRLPGDWGAAKP